MFDRLFGKKKLEQKSFIIDTAITLAKTSLAILGETNFDKTEEHIIYFYGNGVVDYLCQKMKVSQEEYERSYTVLLGVMLNKSMGLNVSISSLMEYSKKIKIEKVMVIAAEDAKEIVSGNSNHFPRLFKFIRAYRNKFENDIE